MLNLQYTQSIITTIALLIAYVISATISGPIQAFVAKMMGDSTAEDEGFLSLNPLQHVDLVGIVLVVITGFGWSTIVPIDPSQIKHSWRTLRLLITYGAKTAVSLVLMGLSLLSLIIIYGSHSLKTALIMFFSDTTVLQDLAKLYPHHSSLSIACVIILMAFVFINSFLATWSAINNSFQFALVMGFEKDYAYMAYAHYLQILGPVIILILFGGYIHAFFLSSIIYIVQFFAALLGV